VCTKTTSFIQVAAFNAEKSVLITWIRRENV
jgi:hypothetical protein